MKFFIFKRLLAIAVLGCILSACADLKEDISETGGVPSSNGIIYGNFSVSQQAGSVGTNRKFGLTLQKVGAGDDSPITIPFGGNGGLFVTDLEPGDYKVTGTVTYVRDILDGAYPRYFPFKSGDWMKFTIKPRLAVYIGDLHMSYSVSYESAMIHTQWHIDSIVNTFDKTTEALHSKYPKLNEFSALSVVPVAQINNVAPDKDL